MSGLYTTAVALSSGDWRSGPLLVAAGSRSRRRGVRAVPFGWGVLLRTRSVHGFGLDGPLTAVGLGPEGRVRWVRRLDPSRILIGRRTTWIAELPPGDPPPAVGTALCALPIVGRWPGHSSSVRGR